MPNGCRQDHDCPRLTWQRPLGRLRLLAHPASLARWCRIRSYLDSAAAHGLTALDAVATAA